MDGVICLYLDLNKSTASMITNKIKYIESKFPDIYSILNFIF